MAAIAVTAVCSLGTAAAAPTEITIPGDRVFPESITAAADGTLIFGSLAQGDIYRVAPGASTAEIWIPQAKSGMQSTLGVLADDKSGTLWACSDDFGMVQGEKPTQLKTFDLKSGAPKSSYVLPGGHTLCNDIVIGPDGAAYVTDSWQAQVLRLKLGASAFEVWAKDDRFVVKDGAGPDGLVFGADGNLYVNLYQGNALFRIDVNKDGSAGKITLLEPSQKIALCDALRKFGNKLLMIEGTGSLDLVSVEGDKAGITVLKGGFKTPVGVVQVGDIAWVLEGQLGSLFNAKEAGPPSLPFRIYAVPLPR